MSCLFMGCGNAADCDATVKINNEYLVIPVCWECFKRKVKVKWTVSCIEQRD